MQRNSMTTAGMTLRVVGGIGVGVGIMTSVLPVVTLGAVVAGVGHLLYRRGKDAE